MTPEETRIVIDDLVIETRHDQAIRPLLISVVDAARVLGIDRQLFDERVVPELTTVKIGRRRLVPTAEIDRYVSGLIAEAAEAKAVAEPPVRTSVEERIRRINEHMEQSKQAGRAPKRKSAI